MKNYVLCSNLNEHCIDTLKRLRQEIELKHAKIHIITVVETHMYNVGILPFVYPTEGQYAAIEEAALMVMKGLAASLNVSDEKLVLKCFFHSTREEKIVSYLKEVNADLVVTSTRGKNGIDGLFTSSLTDFLCKYSPCDVLAMRPKK